MPKKLNVLDWYKIGGIVVLFLTMVALKFHMKDGKLAPIKLPNEWYAMFSGCLVYTFTSISLISVQIPKVKALEHVKGWVWLGTLVYIGICYFAQMGVSEAEMAIAGSLQGFLYGSQ